MGRLLDWLDTGLAFKGLATGQHGNEVNGHQQGCEQGHDDGDPQISKDLPRDPLHKNHG